MIVQIVPGIFMIIYADDLSIRMRLCGNIAVDEMTINRQMAAVQSWMDSNLLLFNDTKTEILDISKKNNNLYKDLKLTMRNGVVTPKKSCRMLGVHFTYNMRNDWYICQTPGNLVSALNQRMYVLSKLKSKCGKQQFHLLVYGLLYSKAGYCIQQYSQCTEVLKDKVRMILNRAVRLGTNTRLIEHRRTQSMYKELGFLSFDALIDSHDLQLLMSIMWYGEPQSLAKKINIVGNELGGSLTRSRSSQYRATLTRDNQGVYQQRREAFVSRSLRKYHSLCQKEPDLATNLIGAGEKKRKKLLKNYLLENDFKK